MQVAIPKSWNQKCQCPESLRTAYEIVEHSQADDSASRTSYERRHDLARVFRQPAQRRSGPRRPALPHRDELTRRTGIELGWAKDWAPWLDTNYLREWDHDKEGQFNPCVASNFAECALEYARGKQEFNELRDWFRALGITIPFNSQRALLARKWPKRSHEAKNLHAELFERKMDETKREPLATDV